MRNFRQMVKMMVMALVMAAAFCSCSVAGGSDYYDTTSSSRASGVSESTTNGPSVNVGFAIKLPSVSVSISGDEEVRMSETETAVITAEASEGASLAWYVNGMFQTAETGTTFQMSCAYPGVYDVTCVAVNADGTMAKSASMAVTVRP